MREQRSPEMTIDAPGGPIERPRLFGTSPAPPPREHATQKAGRPPASPIGGHADRQWPIKGAWRFDGIWRKRASHRPDRSRLRLERLPFSCTGCRGGMTVLAAAAIAGLQASGKNNVEAAKSVMHPLSGAPARPRGLKPAAQGSR